MKKRCFSFGCSFVQWMYPTWADFIGYSFEEYYNFGHGGINNSIIGMRVIEVDELYKFTPDDLVLIGMTGFSRVNLFLDHGSERGIWAPGDPVRDIHDDYLMSVPKWTSHVNTIKFMRDNYWKRRWGVYNSWVYFKYIKNYLQAKNIPHKIVMSLDNKDFKENNLPKDELLNDHEMRMVNDLYSMCDIPISLEEYNDIHKIYTYKDTHPFIDVYFKFLIQYFPEYVTEKNTKIFNDALERIKDIEDTDIAFKILTQYKEEVHFDNYTWTVPLYGTYI